ncbi:MAG: lectin like domain-containing protein [Propionibacteriaceae bacterium]|jgi:C1A family cysteine protease|nr:lectin like domain-containing protein [Propionibacteriaceae bacterium]
MRTTHRSTGRYWAAGLLLAGLVSGLGPTTSWADPLEPEFVSAPNSTVAQSSRLNAYQSTTPSWSAAPETTTEVVAVADDLPAAYDLRDLGVIAPVRDQGKDGTCWAFAATGSAMSELARDGHPGVSLSVSHLVASVFNDRGVTGWIQPSGAILPTDPTKDGGNALLAATAWSKWYGAQTTAAYPDALSGQALPWSELMTRQYQMANARIFNPLLDGLGRLSATSLAAMQQAIFTEGGLATAYFADSGQSTNADSAIYNLATSAVYNPPRSVENPTNATNHGVLLIGWDNNYPVTNFATAPPGAGAWLVQNSWGTQAGQDGYFWLSYYDASLSQSWLFDLEPAVSSQSMMFYDDAIPGDKVTYNTSTIYGANIFQLPRGSNQALRSLSLVVERPGQTYDISIYAYPKKKPNDGTQIDISTGVGSSQRVTFQQPGWYEVDLEKPPLLAAGSTFAVVVQVTDTLTRQAEIPVEYTYTPSRQLAVAKFYRTVSPGQSFISRNGSSWKDISETKPGNLAIKAVLDQDTTGIDGFPVIDNNAIKLSVHQVTSGFFACAWGIFKSFFGLFTFMF